MNLKSIFLKFPVTLGVLTVGVWLFYGMVIQAVNPVSSSSLENMTKMKIVEINQSSPHFVLQKEDGTTINANFPYDLTRSGVRQYLINASIAKSLSGCVADIQLVELKTMFRGEYRVFRLMCNGFALSNREIVDAYERSESGRFRVVKVIAIFGLILFGLYVDLRRKNG